MTTSPLLGGYPDTDDPHPGHSTELTVVLITEEDFHRVAFQIMAIANTLNYGSYNAVQTYPNDPAFS